MKVVIDDPSLTVKFDKETLTFEGSGSPIRLKPGEHKFIVERDGLEVETDYFTVKKNSKHVLEVTVIDGKVVVRKDDQKPKASTLANKSDSSSPPKRGWHGWPADAPAPAISPFDAEQAKKHQDAWARHLGVPVEFTNSIGMKFCLIPPGEFMMGSTPEQIEEALQRVNPKDKPTADERIRSEGPQHKVILTQPFYFGTYEVTQRDYKSVTGANPSIYSQNGPQPAYRPSFDTSDMPVENVSWNDFADFCTKLSVKERLKPRYSRTGMDVLPAVGNGYRLPTEAEWEFACRAGTTTRVWFAKEEEAPQFVWLSHPAGGRPYPVGQLKPNPFGLYDIYGNACEFVEDGWSLDGHEKFASKPAIDPRISFVGAPDRILRGIGPSSTRRAPEPVWNRRHYFGARAALSVDAVKFALTNPMQTEVPPIENGVKEPLALRGHTGEVMCVVFSPDGALLASASGDKTVMIWDAVSGQATLTLVGHTARVSSVAFSSDGKRLASASIDKSVKVWDVVSGQVTHTLEGHTAGVSSVAFSPDGKWLASASHDKTVIVWDATSLQKTLTLKGHIGSVTSVAFSPDGKRLASVSYDRALKVWDTTSGQEIPELKDRMDGFYSVAFRSDGKRLASANPEQTVRIWDANSGKIAITLTGHTGNVMCVAFSSDGKWIASVSMDLTVKVWDTASGQETLTLKGHTSNFVSVAFSPDGKRLASASFDQTVKVWDLAPRQADDKGQKITAQDWKGWPKDAPAPAIAPFDSEQAKTHQETWAKHLGVPVEYTNSIGMKFRLIPPGEFTMGSTAEEIEATIKIILPNDLFWQQCARSESPRHTVVLTKPIYVGAHEVTQAQYERVTGMNPSHFASTGAGKEVVAALDTSSHPVEMVSWNDAAEFCVKLSQQENFTPFYLRDGEQVTLQKGTGYRLPTEAEWEFACRAGTTTKYWIGENDAELIRVGWFHPNSGNRTHAVGELQSNPFGLHDVYGNVFEWVQDWWAPEYYAEFQEEPAFDPNGSTSSSSKRVLRGGAWFFLPMICRSSNRMANVPTYRIHRAGFRVALTVEAVRFTLK